jgi:ligand-binding sensor domain-containing protein
MNGFGKSGTCSCFSFLLMLIGFLFSFTDSNSQSFSYTHYDMGDGIAGSTVHGMGQDRDGFIWFGTETGLSCFDGSRFRNFRREDGLPSNEVFAIFADRRNRVWIGTYKNAVCYYFKGKIYNQQNNSVLKKIHLNGEIEGFAEEEKGNILVISQEWAFIIQPDGRVLKRPADSNINFKIVNGVGSKFSTYLSLKPNPYKSQAPYYYIAHVNDVNFTFKKSIDLFKWDTCIVVIPANNVPQILTTNRHTRIKPLDDSTIVYLNDSITGARFYNVKQQRFTSEYLKGYTIQDVFKDIEGNLWFTTKESGVFKLSPAAFRSFLFDEKNVPVPVISFFKYEGDLFVGTSKNKCWKLVQGDKMHFKRLEWNAYKTLPLLLGKNGHKQLISYASSDFFFLDERIGENIKTLMPLNDTLLVSTNRAVSLRDYPDMKILKTLYSGRSTCSYRIGEDYYIGTLNGLFRIDKNGRESFIGQDNPVLRDRISAFAGGEDGTLWIATYENGVIGYKDGKIIANIAQDKGGLNSNICRCLFCTENALWVGTEKGLNKIDITRHQKYTVTEKFTMADGLTSDIVNAIYVEGHNVFVGTANGLVYFDETKVPRRSICYLQMTSIKVSDKPYDIEEDNFSLSHKDNNISFEFSGISFLSEGDIKYVYRLLGLEDQWKTVKAPLLTYPSLPSGKYKLEVIAINKFNDSSKVMVRNFEINKMLSEKKWFQLLLLLAIVVVVLLVIQLRFYFIQKKVKEKNLVRQQIIELEHMALRAQMSPHFIFNCLNSIQHHIIKRDMIQVNVYLSKFAALVRQTLDNAPKIYIYLREELEYLINYIDLEKLQIGDAFEYAIIIDPMVDPDLIKVPNMIIQPFVENAIKHGIGQLSNHAKLMLKFNYLQKENMLECIIEDNGPGIDLTKEIQQRNGRKYSPKGISITQSRIETLNQISETKNKITILKEEVTPLEINKGTRIIILFPL